MMPQKLTEKLSSEATTKPKRSGVSIFVDHIRIVGGGSRNTLLNQLTADRAGRRVVAGPAEATAAGNALTQALGSGDLQSLDEIRAVVRKSFELEEFTPGK